MYKWYSVSHSYNVPTRPTSRATTESDPNFKVVKLSHGLTNYSIEGSKEKETDKVKVNKQL